MQNIRLSLIGLPISMLSMWLYEWDEIQRGAFSVITTLRYYFGRNFYKTTFVSGKKCIETLKRVNSWQIEKWEWTNRKLKGRAETHSTLSGRAPQIWSEVGVNDEKCNNKKANRNEFRRATLRFFECKSRDQRVRGAVPMELTSSGTWVYPPIDPLCLQMDSSADGISSLSVWLSLTPSGDCLYLWWSNMQTIYSRPTHKLDRW